MNILPVRTIKELSTFIEFPYRLYKNDPVWIPPFRSEQRSQSDPKRNSLLDHYEWQFFLLEDKGKVIGRIAAFVDLLAMDFWKTRIGLFGYYECIPDLAGSPLLLDAAIAWVKARNCLSIRAPWTFISQEWGLVVEGFTPSPVVMAPK